jgi:hypothetical protein
MEGWEQGFWKSINNGHEEKRQHELEYGRLAAGSLGRRPPVVGERVLINAGLVGCGHLWGRLEAVVLQVADNAAQVKYTDELLRKDYTKWVPFPVITDLLETKE